MLKDHGSLSPSTLFTTEYPEGAPLLATTRGTTATRPRLTAVPTDGNTAPVLKRAEADLDAPPVWLLEEVPALDERSFYDKAKRVFDFSLALVAVLATLPLTIAIAIAIKLDSKGPVFFCQERLGKGTRRFSMIKFRTMVTNCDELTQELMAMNEATGPMFKMRQDPRITRVGRILRRTSLDELPQLFNVLFGQMSLVGPRPALPRELNGFDKVQRLRTRVLPGLTGLWQVSGRSDLPFDEMVRLDIAYMETRSLLNDVRIILKTVPSVLFGVGAY
jgi:lipopolysaccharide/colanic/teichoic acid biosynthesis glycosyltransferase